MHTSFTRRFARGFSMIELMVAMVIGLIGMIIIFQVFEVSEGIKRTTTSGGDAQQNGAIAMYVLEHDVRNSGMSFNDTGWAGCSIIGWSSAMTPNDFPQPPATMLTVPVRITPGAASYVPDQVTVMYGSQPLSASGSGLDISQTLSTDPLRVTTVFGYSPGDLILVMEPPLPPNPVKKCSLMEITKITGNDLFHEVGNYQYTPAGGTTVTVPSTYNKPGGLGVVYAGGSGALSRAVVYNLGSTQGGSTAMPVYATYVIQNNTLVTIPMFVIAVPPPAVADNIVHMRAVYGLDDGIDNTTVPYNATYKAGDGIIDRYVDGAVVPNWSLVLAVRVAILARSTLKEKPNAGLGAPCDTTTVEPAWSGSPWANAPTNFNTRLNVASNPDGTPNPDWQCYRYKVFEATIPVRNWVWSSS